MTVQACANIVHQADPARWRAVMSAPPASRERMLPVYAANIEISRAPWVTKEPFIALMRLQWWRDVMGELREGTPRKHEVVDALAHLPASVASALDVAIDARQADVDKDAFLSVDDLSHYARDTTYGAMAGAYLALAGDPVNLPKILSLSTALGLARVLQACVDLHGSGWRCFGPDWNNDRMQAAAQLGLDQWDQSKDLLNLTSPSKAAFIEAAGTNRFLKHIQDNPQSVTDGTVPSYATRNALTRAKVAWRIPPFKPDVPAE